MSKSLFPTEKKTAAKPADKAAVKPAVKKEVAKKEEVKKEPKGAAPREGGKTRVVWDILDGLKKSGKSRKEMLEACTAQGVNSATASTQYGLWRANQIEEGTWEPIQAAMDKVKQAESDAKAKVKAKEAKEKADIKAKAAKEKAAKAKVEEKEKATKEKEAKAKAKPAAKKAPAKKK